MNERNPLQEIHAPENALGRIEKPKNNRAKVLAISVAALMLSVGAYVKYANSSTEDLPQKTVRGNLRQVEVGHSGPLLFDAPGKTYTEDHRSLEAMGDKEKRALTAYTYDMENEGDLTLEEMFVLLYPTKSEQEDAIARYQEFSRGPSIQDDFRLLLIQGRFARMKEIVHKAGLEGDVTKVAPILVGGVPYEIFLPDGTTVNTYEYLSEAERKRVDVALDLARLMNSKK